MTRRQSRQEIVAIVEDGVHYLPAYLDWDVVLLKNGQAFLV